MIVSEYIGAHSVLMCDCGGQQVVVELKSETPIPLGETLRFRVNPQGIHLFDTESELGDLNRSFSEREEPNAEDT